MRKSTRLLVVLLAFCMALGLFTGCDKNRSATIDIASYSDAISALQDTTAELTAELEAVNKSIEQLESSTDLENIATLEMLKETKATLEEQILSANATIETLKSENTSKAEKIASLESAKTSLNNEVAAMRTRLNSMTSGAKGDKGDTGAAGVDGKDGTTPRLRINAETNMWEVSYDNGVTWTSMGSTATGANGANGTNGADGKDGITPRLQINAKTNMWEVSYDNGSHEVSPTISARCGTGGNNVPLVEQEASIYCIVGNVIDRQPENGGNGCGYQEKIAYTLTAMDRHAVFSRQRVDVFTENEVVCTESARQHKDATDLVMQPPADEEETCILRSANLIRRLTPLECERLQGFPDGWTNIPGASDSARYKALGNSVAIPCVEYVMRGIAIVLRSEHRRRVWIVILIVAVESTSAGI